MSNLPLQPLVWDSQDYTQSAFHQYLVRKDGEARKNSKSQYEVAYGRINTQQSFDVATGFATIDEAKAWAWNHYNEKMQPYVNADSITDIANWFKAAKPEPTTNDLMTQMGCHLEEFCELLDATGDLGEMQDLQRLADWYKNENFGDDKPTQRDNIEILDALCDQIVTATGVAYMMGFDIEGALKEVIRSNNSKMVKGKFQYDENGKMKKGESYSAPDLKLFVKQGE